MEINSLHEWATGSLESAIETQAKLDEAYLEILKRQEKYGVNLVDNLNFEVFTKSGIPELIWSDEMKEVFGETAVPLRDVKEMNDAISTLYWWRES